MSNFLPNKNIPRKVLTFSVFNLCFISHPIAGISDPGSGLNNGIQTNTTSEKKSTTLLPDTSAQKLINHYRKLHHAPPLDYDELLQQHAEEWAQKVHVKVLKDHNHSKRVAFFSHPHTEGENVFVAIGNLTSNAAINNWYSEKAAYDFNHNQFSFSSAQFTQLVWKNTRKMGIATIYNNNLTVVVARFKPPGNTGSNISFRRNVIPKVKVKRRPGSVSGVKKIRKKFRHHSNSSESSTMMTTATNTPIHSRHLKMTSKKPTGLEHPVDPFFIKNTTVNQMKDFKNASRTIKDFIYNEPHSHIITTTPTTTSTTGHHHQVIPTHSTTPIVIPHKSSRARNSTKVKRENTPEDEKYEMTTIQMVTSMDINTDMTLNPVTDIPDFQELKVNPQIEATPTSKTINVKGKSSNKSSPSSTLLEGMDINDSKSPTKRNTSEPVTPTPSTMRPNMTHQLSISLKSK